MTGDNAPKNFLGIPIDGDIDTRSRDRRQQRPLDEFAPILQAVLDDPTVVEFGWAQYTPYFNDGDPCVFRPDGVWVRTTSDGHVKGTRDLGVGYSSHPSLGGRPSRRDSVTRKRVTGDYEGPDEGRYDRCQALQKAVEGGEFNDVLFAAFGDHAKVVVRRDGILVESYDHD